MLFQVLIYKEGVQGGCIKPCQEHIDHNQQIHLPVLHPEGQVFVVVLEPVR